MGESLGNLGPAWIVVGVLLTVIVDLARVRLGARNGKSHSNNHSYSMGLLTEAVREFRETGREMRGDMGAVKEAIYAQNIILAAHTEKLDRIVSNTQRRGP
ncbi:MAG: hypothetical protein C4551_06655 [Bacillota bacterium]|nr:MAG: hypothetical protein C4551_06655 [Bacillota bacterium]